MVQLDEKGGWGPTKVFPCDCGSEGIMVTIDDDPYDDKEQFGVGLAFWEMNRKFEKSDSLTYWERIKYAWRILRGGSLWMDMIMLSEQNARNLLAKNKRETNKKDKRGDTPIVPVQEVL